MCCGFDGAHEQRAVIVIVRNGVADGFSCADAVFIVAVDIGLWHILALAFQLLCPEIWDRSSETTKQSEFPK